MKTITVNKITSLAVFFDEDRKKKKEECVGVLLGCKAKELRITLKEKTAKNLYLNLKRIFEDMV